MPEASRCRLAAAMHSSGLARSFVVTVALCGCAGTTTSNPPPPEPDPEPAPVSVVVEEDGPFATTTGDPATAPTTGPDETVAPAPTTTVVSSVVKGKIMKRDGACFWVTTPECDPGTRCNPPRPEPIVCPAVGEPLLDQIRERRRDGTCILLERPPPPKCPPNIPCNPPGPRRVELPCPRA